MRQTDVRRQTSDAHHCLMPLPYGGGGITTTIITTKVQFGRMPFFDDTAMPHTTLNCQTAFNNLQTGLRILLIFSRRPIDIFT